MCYYLAVMSVFESGSHVILTMTCVSLMMSAMLVTLLKSYWLKINLCQTRQNVVWGRYFTVTEYITQNQWRLSMSSLVKARVLYCISIKICLFSSRGWWYPWCMCIVWIERVSGINWFWLPLTITNPAHFPLLHPYQQPPREREERVWEEMGITFIRGIIVEYFECDKFFDGVTEKTGYGGLCTEFYIHMYIWRPYSLVNYKMAANSYLDALLDSSPRKTSVVFIRKCQCRGSDPCHPTRVFIIVTWRLSMKTTCFFSFWNIIIFLGQKI